MNLYHDTENHKDTRQSHGPGHCPRSRRLYRRRDMGGFKSPLPVSPLPGRSCWAPTRRNPGSSESSYTNPRSEEGVLASAQRHSPASLRAPLPGKGPTGGLCRAQGGQAWPAALPHGPSHSRPAPQQARGGQIGKGGNQTDA